MPLFGVYKAAECGTRKWTALWLWDVFQLRSGPFALSLLFSLRRPYPPKYPRSLLELAIKVISEPALVSLNQAVFCDKSSSWVLGAATACMLSTLDRHRQTKGGNLQLLLGGINVHIVLLSAHKHAARLRSQTVCRSKPLQPARLNIRNCIVIVWLLHKHVIK